jgi:hypothetical protein
MNRQTEWAVIAALILFMSFTRGLPAVRTPVGRAVALGVVVYVFKSVSPAIGLLLGLLVACCWSGREGVDETLAEPTEMCECDNSFTYNSGSKKCEKGGSPDRMPLRCTCIAGEMWDAKEKKCVPKKVETAPPVSMPSSSAGAADLAAVEAQAAAMAPSSVPQTTGSAAAATMAAAPPPPPPTTEKFSAMDSTMTRGKQYSPW